MRRHHQSGLWDTFSLIQFILGLLKSVSLSKKPGRWYQAHIAADSSVGALAFGTKPLGKETQTQKKFFACSSVSSLLSKTWYDWLLRLTRSEYYFCFVSETETETDRNVSVFSFLTLTLPRSRRRKQWSGRISRQHRFFGAHNSWTCSSDAPRFAAFHPSRGGPR